MSSRDVSGPYGSGRRQAGDDGGRSWPARPATGSGAGYGRSRGGQPNWDSRERHRASGEGRPQRRDSYEAAPGDYPAGGPRPRGDGYGAGDGYDPRGAGGRGGYDPARAPRSVPDRYNPDRYGRQGNGPGRRGAGRPADQYGTGRRAERYSDGYGPGEPGYGGGRGGRGSGGRGGAGGPGGPGGGRGRGPGRGNGAGRAKVKGSWWRHWSWRKVLGLTAASFGGLVLLGVGGVSYAYASTSVPTGAAQAAMQQQSTVYFSDGKTVIGTFGTTNRQLLTYNQIPAVMRDATLAAEDRGFYTEGGVSPRGIMRAAYEDVFHGGGSGGSLAGGSTITQQFVRGYYSNIGTQQTATRKIKEIFVALKVAKEKSKAWILTQYLNTIYLGQGAYGIGAAAQTYFGEPASQLTVAQAAMIAALIQSPGYYPTAAGHQALVTRWHYVLNGLVKMGDLSPQQAAAEKFPRVNSAEQQQAGVEVYDPYVLEVVKNELEGVYHYTSTQIDNEGLRVVTTISKPMMDKLYSAVNQNKQLMKQDGGALPSYALVGAELQNPQTGAIMAMYPGPGQNFSQAECSKLHCDENAAVYTREQVGSSFKPYVLSAAVQKGMNVQSSTLDGYSPLWIPPDSGSYQTGYASLTSMPSPYYQVKNDPSDGSQGPVTVAKATAMSLNTAYTDLIHRVGTQDVVNLAKQFGVDTVASGLQTDVGHVGMALGQDSLSVNEQDTMLATLDNGGMYHQAHLIQQITQGTAVYPAKVPSWQVLTAAQDSQVQYAMSFDTTGQGTGTAAAMNDGRPIIAKTGTTNDAQSAFFIGAIPQYALTVGIFTDKQGKTTETLNGLGGSAGGGFGGYWPARIWKTFAESSFAQLPVQQFPSPQFSGQAWNMLSSGMMPATTPTAPPKHTKPTTQPTAPTSPTTPATASPTPSVPAQPTCGPLTGTPCGGNGGGGGGNGGGNGPPAGGAAGFVVLIPVRWLLAKRKRKRS